MNMRWLGCFALVACLCLVNRPAQAQVVVVGAPMYGTSVVVQRPVIAAPVVSAPVVTAGYGSYYGGYSAYSPVVSTYAASAAYVAPAPVVAYRPVVSYPTYYAAPYVAARPVIVSPKVYVPGQPVRNTLRAITP